MSSKFTQKAEIALNKSVCIAEKLGHTYIGTEHVLIALSEDENACAAVIMKKVGITNSRINDAVKSYSGIGKATKLTSQNTTPKCRKILENSYKIAKNFSAERIGTEHLLLAILEERDSVAIKIINNMGVNPMELKEDTIIFLKTNERATQNKKIKNDTEFQYLKKYAKNITQSASNVRYDPVIGREGEIDRLIRILSRKNKNNPCLIGEAGVGKTAIVEELAQRIVDGKVASSLRGKNIYSLDFTAMVAGAKYRGDFEERIKGVMDEARSNPDIILFIDEIHTIVGAGSAEGAIDAANIMKPELARGDIQIIGATTATEYKRYIEKDSALERRFQTILVEEPSREKSIEILKGIKDRYEDHHRVIIEDTAIEAAVDLSIRYINDRFLPDKAIDLLDEACAKEVISYSINIDQKTRYCYDKLKQLYSGDFVFNNIVGEDDMDEVDFTMHNKLIEELKNDTTIKPIITDKSIVDVVCEIIGVDFFDETCYLDYNVAFTKLSNKVIGQDTAVSALINSILRSSCGISSPNRPKGIFLFAGKSGVGKTALAKECAKLLFNNEDSLIRIDMSEYSESFSTSKLIGSAPGYIGYNENSSILDKIRKHPYSVVLLDEIEKAHPDVIALFLQIFDYGFIQDSSGRKINFRNTYIIMTSNIGANTRYGGIGFFNDSNGLDIENELKKQFKLEFINRIDEIILFNTLNLNDMINITSKELEEVKRKFKDFPIDISISDNVINHIAKEALKKGLGARPIIKIISKEIESPLVRLIIEKNPSTLYRVKFELEDNKISLIKHCMQLQG